MEYPTTHPVNERTRSAARVRLERMSEPWAIGKTAAIGVVLCLAVLFGTWVASGQMEYVGLVGVWLVAALIIIFVQDQWWSPALIITALGISTAFGGTSFSGYEIGVVILAITFPVKMAMKTLRKADPVIHAGIFFWLLLSFACIHAIVCIAYNHIEGVQLKNVVKAYYTVIAPLAFYGLMVRYCHNRTVIPACIAIYCCTLFATFVSMFAFLKGLDIEPSLGDVSISVVWLSGDSAAGYLRMAPVTVFIGALAYWPVVKSFRGKMFLSFGLLVGVLGALLSGGRVSIGYCILAAAAFAVVRNRIWMAVPAIIAVAAIAAISTANPDVMNSLPETFQRALAPFNFSDQKTEEQQVLESSNTWHSDLRIQSLDYWLYDTNSFWLGHGFKAWDESLSDESEGYDYQRHLEAAIEMGRTENLVSSTTNIFGVTGLVLYAGFLIFLAARLWKACKLIPVGRPERAICEFSEVHLCLSLLFSPTNGGTPNFQMLLWVLGVLAARNYLAVKPVPVPEAELPSLPSFIPRDLHAHS
jgi:hypothetical protein